MNDSDLPLMDDLPRAALPVPGPLVLGSGSPRRKQLLEAAGYAFEIMPAGESAECGMCSRETAPQLVARYAYRKAIDVAGRVESGLVLAADTVASVFGQILGKPANADHARDMLGRLSGRKHEVFTGVCLWDVSENRCVVDVTRTQLQMQPLSKRAIDDYLETMLWEGKAGAFGYQDGNDWIEIVGDGSASNVVGLPMERLAELLENFDSIADNVCSDP